MSLKTVNSPEKCSKLGSNFAAVQNYNLEVEISKDIVLNQLNEKTFKNSIVFNDKFKKYFYKNYKSNIFKRLKIKK